VAIKTASHKSEKVTVMCDPCDLWPLQAVIHVPLSSVMSLFLSSLKRKGAGWRVDSAPNAKVIWPHGLLKTSVDGPTDTVQGLMWPHNFWTCLPQRRRLVQVTCPTTSCFRCLRSSANFDFQYEQRVVILAAFASTTLVRRMRFCLLFDGRRAQTWRAVQFTTNDEPEAPASRHTLQAERRIYHCAARRHVVRWSDASPSSVPVMRPCRDNAPHVIIAA